jgi:hypothetical protein
MSASGNMMLNSVLGLRSTSKTCPENVARIIETIPFFKKSARAAGASAASRGYNTRVFDAKSSHSGGSRFIPTLSEDGFESVPSRKFRGSAATSVAAPAPIPAPTIKPVIKNRFGWLDEEETSSTPSVAASAAPSVVASAAPSVAASAAPSVVASASPSVAAPKPSVVPLATPAAIPAPTPTAKPALFRAGMRKELDIEEQIYLRVRGMINRLDGETYAGTKSSLQQILSNDDTKFIDDILKYIILKASSEEKYCRHYVNLVHELAIEFPHIQTPISTILRDYMNIFVDCDIPDEESSEYATFLESQEKKRNRRGYSQFAAELLLKNDIDLSEFMALLNTIIHSIETTISVSAKSKECEDYIDCLKTLCTVAKPVLRKCDTRDLSYKIQCLEAMTHEDGKTAIDMRSEFVLLSLVELIKSKWA